MAGDRSATTRFAEVFKQLTGQWRLERAISSGETFSGKAEFSKIDENNIRLHETGTLILPNGEAIEASRSWVWQLAEPNELLIFYDESPIRLYHHLSLSSQKTSWVGTAEHWCEPDTYVGEYIFTNESIQVDQAVRGPAKDYSVKSIYSK